MIKGEGVSEGWCHWHVENLKKGLALEAKRGKGVILRLAAKWGYTSLFKLYKTEARARQLASSSLTLWLTLCALQQPEGGTWKF